MHALSPSSSQRNAPHFFWRMAEAFLNTLHARFGAPVELARRALTPWAHRLIASWLRVGEALMRRLLIIEAAACRSIERRRPPRKRSRARRPACFEVADPASWRVGFRACMERRRRARPRRRAPAPVLTADPRLRSGLSLALRYEALMRVLNDPAAAARRLARCLRAAPHRLAGALRAPPQARARVVAFDALTRAAQSAGRCFNSS